MITESSQRHRDRIREAPKRCGRGHALNLDCGLCAALAAQKHGQDRADTEEVYRLEREAESTIKEEVVL